LVTLEYIPGCAEPVHVGVLLDGRPAGLEQLPPNAAIQRDNLGTWHCHVAAVVQLADLACWGHQQKEMPWER
jgi:hypothetical protein